MTSTIDVEVVFATECEQTLLSLEIQLGATVDDVIQASSLGERFGEAVIAAAPVGIWGRTVGRDHVVAAGDRVEIYRELKIDPREARRRLARAGQTMTGEPKSEA